MEEGFLGVLECFFGVGFFVGDGFDQLDAVSLSARFYGERKKQVYLCDVDLNDG